jgi:hypothetical protein
MFFRAATRTTLISPWMCLVLLLGQGTRAAGQGQPSKNLLANPSFELGSQGWHADTGGHTEARFAVEAVEAPDGRHGARLTVGKVEEWGVQFGQTLDAGAVGRTYTFAAVARSAGKPVTATLQIERRAEPWDRAARSRPFTLTRDTWTELHVTFPVEEPFRQGWFAYITCTEPNVELLVDMFRLYEGEYVPYEEARREQAAPFQASLFDADLPERQGALGQRVELPSAHSPLSTSDSARWAKLPEDETNHTFQGDAVLTNDRLVVCLRRGGDGAEVYSKRADAPAPRAVLLPVCETSDVRLASVRIVENTPSVVSVDAAFKSGDATAVLRYELEMGGAFVRTEARSGASGLRVRAPSRFVVLPDFFADDIVIDAAEIPVPRAELPSEHFLLHMIPGRKRKRGRESFPQPTAPESLTGSRKRLPTPFSSPPFSSGGDAIVMCVSDSANEDVRIDLSGEGARRMVDQSEIGFGKDGRIWVAVVEAPDAWHVRDVDPGDAGQVLPLDWRMPYAAQWRVDWTRSGGLTDSWEMIAERPGGRYEKHGWFGQPHTIGSDRRRWTTVLGWFYYPCWVDRQGRGFLQPPANRLRFEGPALIYPINRTRDTPLDALTVVDVVRATLGVGPCEYILDVESQGTAMKGRATCATRDTLNPIYAAGRQRQERATIEKALDDVVAFVTHIRSRIDAYVDFGHELLAYLERQRKSHPELADFLSEMETLTRAIDERLDARKDEIRTPAYVVGLTEKFRNTLLDYEGDDALDRCKAITGAIVRVGGNQDELVGECRMAVKILRQRAGLAMAADPRTAEIAEEIRRRTQEVLRNPASYEAPRH